MNELPDIINCCSLQLQDTARQEIISGLDYTEQFGLTLTEAQVDELSVLRFKALKRCGLIEFGEGIMKKLLYAFCDSSYIDQNVFSETLADLQDVFYDLKSQAGEALSDDKLIDVMVSCYNDKAGGSIELLSDILSEELRSVIRKNYSRKKKQGCLEFPNAAVSVTMNCGTVGYKPLTLRRSEL